MVSFGQRYPVKPPDADAILPPRLFIRKRFVSLHSIHAVPGLHPSSMQFLATRFGVHADPRSGDPGQFAALAPRLVGLVDLVGLVSLVGLALSGKSKVPGPMMAQLPELQAAATP